MQIKKIMSRKMLDRAIKEYNVDEYEFFATTPQGEMIELKKDRLEYPFIGVFRYDCGYRDSLHVGIVTKVDAALLLTAT